MNNNVEEEFESSTPLRHLAKLMGIGVKTIGSDGIEREVSDDVLVSVLNALGVDATSESSIETATQEILQYRHGRLVAPTVLHTVGREDTICVNTGILEYPVATLTLENGEKYEGELVIKPSKDSAAFPVNDTFVSTSLVTIPADVPMGYHTLKVTVGDRSEEATLISAPESIKTLDSLESNGKRLWGWMAQLYSIRSSKSWGVGDYADLAQLLVEAKKKTGADFVLVNPLHAGEPVAPLTPSPYLPVARSMVNVTYIHPESIPEYAELDEETRKEIDELHNQVEPLNNDAQIIDRDAMWRVKMRALWLIFKSGLNSERSKDFEQYKKTMGDRLESYAVWCLCYDKWGAPKGHDDWESQLHKDSPEIKGLMEKFPDTLEFYRWLEWIAFAQLHEAQVAAKNAGMRIGVMADMAVGVHPAGSEVWWNPERFAHGATVGAPPDYFNQQGQNWSQPPLHPLELEKTGFKTYRDMVHGMFASAGAVRIDHILGLFRLWWIPENATPKNGAYVYYDSDVMLGILAIEATRANGVVVGEDLGVLPSNALGALAKKEVLGCTVEWFEVADGVFRNPSKWREMTLASVNTHDLPPAAGYLRYEHVDIRERLHLLTGSVEDFRAGAVAEHRAMMKMLVEGGFLDAAILEDENSNEQQIIEALYRALKAATSRLIAASIVDAVGERRAQNQPGTNDEYPNWRIPLADGEGNPVSLDNLFDLPRLKSLSEIMNA
ncbi:4-alpha-glucanotransferase [Gardnerella sp. 2492-Sm]|uniref:4-alpha-glucanotransferase n=1 Tax=unclassified Gardnerella TaxID=2628112 RepID=UPI003D05AB5F